MKFAEGTRVIAPRSEYRIRIYYREPTYARRGGRRNEPYRWTYVIEASCAEEARTIAVAEFEKVGRLSSVGWTREITNIAVVD